VCPKKQAPENVKRSDVKEREESIRNNYTGHPSFSVYVVL